jgi:hypothetical protein
MSLGGALGASWEDILGVQRSDWHGALGAVFRLPGHLGLGAAVQTPASGRGPRLAGTTLSLALSQRLRVRGVATGTSVGAEYGFGERALTQLGGGLDLKPPGPLSALAVVTFERQPFEAGRPHRRTMALGLGVTVGVMRLWVARRWREQGLGSELFVTAALLSRTARS